MKKILSIILCIISVFMMLAFAGCSNESEETVGPRTVVDMRGETIVIPDNATKYCTVYSSSVPMLALLDKNLEHCVMYPKSGWFEYWEFELFEGIEDHAVRVNKREVTAEQIIESGVEIFFWSSTSHQEIVETLSKMGIACVNIQVKDADDLLKALDIIADVLNTDYARSQLGKYKAKLAYYQQYTENQVNKIPEANKKTVLVIGNVDSLVGYGEATYTADWAKFVGLDYIIPSNDGAEQVNLTIEQIYEFDPDIIIANGIFDVETTYADSSWSVLRATKDNMLLSNPSVMDFWSMPTVEVPLQYLWALNKFYPEYAGELKPVDEVISFYKEFYDYEMSVEDATAILDGEHYLLSN